MALPSNHNQGGGLPQRPSMPQRPVTPPSNNGGLPDMPVRPSAGQGTSELAKALRESSNALPPAGDLTSNDRLGQYDFGSQQVANPNKNIYDDEDPFDALPPAQAVVDDEEDATPAPRVEAQIQSGAQERTARQQKAAKEFEDSQSGRKRKSKAVKPQAGELDKKGQNVFVDGDKKKLKPFGGKKSLKTSDLDPRKNIRQQAKAVQAIVIILLIAVVLVGLYNALVPKPTLTTNDVVKTVQQTVAMTNFPIQEGEGFAKDFMKAYWEMGTDPAAQTVLNYYYSGRMVAGSQNYPNRNVSKGYGQTLLYGPTVYKTQYLTDQSANYTIGALVQPEDLGLVGQVDANGNPVQPAVPDGSTAEWQFFSVNVYYDPATLQFSITPDSPTLVPRTQAMPSTSTPQQAIIGTGKAIDDQNSVKATVQGFMEGYRTSSPSDHIRLDQYLKAKPSPELLNGLGGVYQFANKGVDGAVTYVAYGTDTKDVKVLVKVVWEYDYTAGVTTTYNSQYIMTLEPDSNGFAVTKFAPYYYTPKAK